MTIKRKFTPMEVASEIEAIAQWQEDSPQLYDQGYWSAKIHTCGTSYCIGGSFAHNRGLTVDHDGCLYFKNGKVSELWVHELARAIMPDWAMDGDAVPISEELTVSVALRCIASEIRSGTPIAEAWGKYWTSADKREADAYGEEVNV